MGTTGATVTVMVEVAVLVSLSVTRYPTTVSPVNVASGTRVTVPSGLTVKAPSPGMETTPFQRPSAGSRRTTEPGPSPAPVPGVSLASGSTVTATFCGVVRWSGAATAWPTETQIDAVAVVPFVSATR